MSVRANHSYAETVARYQQTVCRCGKAKKARPSFGTFGEEYELAYLRACDFLAGKSATQEASEV